MTRIISCKELLAWTVMGLAAIVLALLWAFGVPKNTATAQAGPLLQEPAPASLPKTAGALDVRDNQVCLLCHGNAGMTTKLGADEISVQVDGQQFAASVHGQKVACVDCHTDKTSFPHTRTNATDARSYSVALSKSCSQCHQTATDDYRDSVHGTAIAAGNNKAATCTDCHTAHAVQPATSIATNIDSCAKCHAKVVDSYRDSVHGQLVTAGRKDAPACADCHTSTGSTHQVQVIKSSNAATSANLVAETCGKCHTKVMENYDSTFHGKKMRLGVTGAAPTCVDCHGTYGIQRVHDPETPLDEAKIAQTCSTCHPGANVNFARGWTGHEEPSPSWFPIVYIAERFLFYLTTTVVAFGIIHVELDLLRWFHTGRKKKNAQEGDNDGPEH